MVHTGLRIITPRPSVQLPNSIQMAWKASKIYRWFLPGVQEVPSRWYGSQDRGSDWFLTKLDIHNNNLTGGCPDVLDMVQENQPRSCCHMSQQYPGHAPRNMWSQMVHPEGKATRAKRTPQP